MLRGEYKKILFDIFGVLEFSDTEKEEALQTFKKKLAFELLKSIQRELPQNQQEWLVNGGKDMNPVRERPAEGTASAASGRLFSNGMNDPVFSEIQKTIQGMYSQETLHDKSKPLFKKLVLDYTEFMSEGLDPESVAKLKEVVNNI